MVLKANRRGIMVSTTYLDYTGQSNKGIHNYTTLAVALDMPLQKTRAYPGIFLIRLYL